MADISYVIFSQRAFNAIVTEVLDKDPTETGGIFIGYVLDNGAWVVVENIPPGYNAIHKPAYFEYDAEFVNYLSNVIALQYKGNLQVLGLWHRHPGSLDVFSPTDDETNLKFASEKPCGAISALVNYDPQMRLTMYHVDGQGKTKQTEWYVDDGETIPEDMLQLRFVSEEDLPNISQIKRQQFANFIKRQKQNEVDTTKEQKNDIHIGEVSESWEAIPIPAPEDASSTSLPSGEAIVVQKPYTLRDALHDIKQIIIRLIH